MKALTEKDLVLTLAGIHGGKKLSPLASSYQADRIQKALAKRDLGWYTRELLDILETCEGKDRVPVLDRLRELMFLGAIQDPVVFAKIQEAITPMPKKTKMSDPFTQFRDKKSERRAG